MKYLQLRPGRSSPKQKNEACKPKIQRTVLLHMHQRLQTQGSRQAEPSPLQYGVDAAQPGKNDKTIRRVDGLGRLARPLGPIMCGREGAASFSGLFPPLLFVGDGWGGHLTEGPGPAMTAFPWRITESWCTVRGCILFDREGVETNACTLSVTTPCGKAGATQETVGRKPQKERWMTVASFCANLSTSPK